LITPKVTVTSARTAGGSGVGVDAARQVDGHHRGAGLTGLLGPLGQAGEGLPQAAPAADAEQAVNDQVSAADRVVGLAGLVPPARGAERAGSARVGTGPRRDRGDGRTAAGQQGARVQGVAAVVSAARQHDDPGPVHVSGVLAEQGRAHRRESRGGPPHQRPVRDELHQRAFGRPDGSHLVSLSHRVSTARRGPAEPRPRAG
jgi:hypothetical protein